MANGQQGAVQGISKQIDCKVNNEKKKKEEVAGDVSTWVGFELTPRICTEPWDYYRVFVLQD